MNTQTLLLPRLPTEQMTNTVAGAFMAWLEAGNFSRQSLTDTLNTLQIPMQPWLEEFLTDPALAFLDEGETQFSRSQRAALLYRAMAESHTPPPDQHSFDELQIALTESLKLQAHYASLLNDYDGGGRSPFTSIGDWIARLKQLKVI